VDDAGRWSAGSSRDPTPRARPGKWGWGGQCSTAAGHDFASSLRLGRNAPTVPE
jgi:hypothetical protein